MTYNRYETVTVSCLGVTQHVLCDDRKEGVNILPEYPGNKKHIAELHAHL
jgi:hypothetical protein